MHSSTRWAPFADPYLGGVWVGFWGPITSSRLVFGNLGLVRVGRFFFLVEGVSVLF